MERKFYVNFTFGNESSWEQRFKGMKVLRNESSKGQKFPRTKVSPMELFFLLTKVLGYESSMSLQLVYLFLQ